VDVFLHSFETIPEPPKASNRPLWGGCSGFVDVSSKTPGSSE
jgi:hypothetical protein